MHDSRLSLPFVLICFHLFCLCFGVFLFLFYMFVFCFVLCLFCCCFFPFSPLCVCVCGGRGVSRNIKQYTLALIIHHWRSVRTQRHTACPRTLMAHYHRPPLTWESPHHPPTSSHCPAHTPLPSHPPPSPTLPRPAAHQTLKGRTAR